MVMPDHIKIMHPFEINVDFQTTSAGEQADDRDIATEASVVHDAAPKHGQRDIAGGSNEIERAGTDSDQNFVIEGGPEFAQKYFSATKAITGAPNGQSKLTARAVREYGTAKASRVISFIHSLPESLSRGLNTWIAVPNPRINVSKTVFSGSDDPLMNACEAFMSRTCTAFTLGQRTADWFMNRKFRITGTNTGQILRYDALFCSLLGLSDAKIKERTLKDWFEVLSSSWFSTKVSTEAMMRGTANEAAVLHYVRNLKFIAGVYDFGMIAMNIFNYLASSPDAVAVIKHDGIFSSVLDGNADISHDSQSFWVALVEIKTKISANTL